MTRHDETDGELGVAARLDAHGFTAAARAVVRHRHGLQLGNEELAVVADAARRLLRTRPTASAARTCT
ncbi:hypothetical protein AB0942_09445 [Streptomyces nodosus]|uniref:hypothetical protein n=1 Tax=Streptomyces nodosus TaxID=40318 RepID=UPI0034547079